ncbi:hypothetical protein D0S45_00520 [Marinifilum sp. JC120]|nr:hypothetical protein D0S45_00520 [Marinifilum sp. JC120]
MMSFLCFSFLNYSYLRQMSWVLQFYVHLSCGCGFRDGSIILTRNGQMSAQHIIFGPINRYYRKIKVSVMFCRDNFILTARIKSKPECENELKKVLEKGVCECFGQEGLLIYNLHQDKDDPAMFLLYGHFTSEASYRMHMDSDPVRRTYDAIVRLADEGPEIKFWTMLEKTGELK